MFTAEGTILFAYFRSERGRGSNTEAIPVNIVLHDAILVSSHSLCMVSYYFLTAFNPLQDCMYTYINYILYYYSNEVFKRSKICSAYLVNKQ